METLKIQPSKLFIYSAVDIRDEFEEKYERAYQNIQQITTGLSDQELHDLLSGIVCKEKQHEEITIGLIYIILTDPILAPKTYRDLTLLTRDGLVCATTNLSILVADKYQKLSDIARRQLLWILRELVKNQVLNVDNIVWNILRQASGGDVSPKNLSLIEGLLDILIEHRLWLEKFQFLIGAVVYTYVRLIEDHNSPILANLRNKEIKFIISLIRDRFVDVIPLGRDFVRLLQNVARIPEFEQLWRDILINPKSLLSTFTGVWQLLQIRTSRRFLQCRLTPEVERKLHFFTSNVKFGAHKRYQDWFQDKYFSTPESHSLRSDLIRFIINAIHPTNDMLCSDLIPRWAIIGWLLTSCTNTTALANAKLALFYDWLFFDPVKDNIMNVEPGILVMFHSIRNHPLVSSTLLDFLCRIMKNFFPKNEDKIRAGVYNSLRKILEKQVIPNLHPLFESPKLDRELKSMIRENFREFCGPSMLVPLSSGDMDNNHPYDQQYHVGSENRLQHQLQQQQQQQQQLLNQQHQQMQQHLQQSMMESSGFGLSSAIGGPPCLTVGGVGIPTVNDMNTATGTVGITPISKTLSGRNESNQEGENEMEAKFSDDDDPENTIAAAAAAAAAVTGGGVNACSIKNEETDDDDDLPLSKVRLKEKPIPDKVELPASINSSFDKFVTTKTSATLDTFLSDLKSCNSLDTEQENYIIVNVVSILKSTLPATTIFPESKNDEKQLAQSISYPLFSLFKIMYQYDEKLKKSVQNILKLVFNKLTNNVGYMLLYFLKVHTRLMARKSATGNNSSNNSSSTGSQSHTTSSTSSSSSSASALGHPTTITFKTNLYKTFCDYLDVTVDQSLAKDLEELESESSQMFLWLLPDILREFKTNMLNNSAVLRILVGCVDAKSLRDLIYSVTQGKLTLFKNDGVLKCVRDSLGYETFEQYCLWQLVQAHDVPIEYLQDLLPDLESSSHAEALTYMLLLLKNEKPTEELTRLLLSREAKSRGDQFVTSALKYWCQEFEENLSEIIAKLLTSKYPSSSPNKRKRPPKGVSQLNSAPTSEQLLSHLEHFRRSCRHGNGTGTGLYVQDPMQRALQQAHSHSSDITRRQYKDLFELAAEDDTSGVGRRGASGRGRKPPASKKDSNSSANNSKKNCEPINNVYSSDEESSEDDWALKTPKRRKKAISDSD